MGCEQSARPLAEWSLVPRVGGVAEERLEVSTATDVGALVVWNADRWFSGVQGDQHAQGTVAPGRIALKAEEVRSAMQVRVDRHRVSVPKAHRWPAGVGDEWCHNEAEVRVVPQSTARVECSDQPSLDGVAVVAQPVLGVEVVDGGEQ